LSACAVSILAAADDDATWFDAPEMPAVPQAGPGELLFFAAPPGTRILHAINRLAIEAHSLEDGWLRMRQCYRGLDPVPDAEIVYRYPGMRGLHIESQMRIGGAVAADDSVQLQDVGRDAELCVAADVRNLVRSADGRYRLRNGPFHRRFLDGYFPMRVTLDVDFPPDRLRIVSVSPAARPGFSVVAEHGHLSIDSLFAGALTVEVVFAGRSDGE
jgi:hypothetical protein